MQIKENIISQGHGWLSPSYVVIHETANPGATALNHVNYWSNNDTYAVHYVGDWTGIAYHCVPNNRLCWQVGNGNSYVIGIELCHATNHTDFEKVWNLGVEWAAWILRQYGWGVDRLISHYDATKMWGGSDHTDPIGYFQEFGKTWEQFKKEVEKKLAGKTGWIKDKVGWWYRNDDGSYPKSQWLKIKNKWYYFDEKGYMKTGWVKDKGKWYYLGENGDMKTGWVKVKNKEGKDKWYYLEGSGAMYSNGFLYIKKKWYGFDKSGEMVEDASEFAVNQNGAITIA